MPILSMLLPKMTNKPAPKTSAPPPPAHVTAPEISTRDLVKEVLDETKELVKVEVALAKEELKDELFRAQRSMMAFAVAGISVLYMVGMLLVTLALAISPGPIPALVIAGSLLAIAASAAAFGWFSLPKKPMLATRARAETSFKMLKERTA